VNYQELNGIIFNELLYNSQYSEYFILNYDLEVHAIVLEKANITDEQYWEILRQHGRYYWIGFTEKTEGIPLIYGILSAQLLVYSRLTGDEYNTTLATNYGFNNHDLQQAYLYSQDAIWLSAKNHLESLGFMTIIPNKTSGPWRFVRYPKSQGYLRLKDLKKLYPHLERSMKELDVEDVNLKQFVNQTALNRPNAISYEFKSNNFVEKIYSPFREAVYNQVYNYFLESEFIDSNSQVKPKLYYRGNDGLFVISENTKSDFNSNQPLENQLIEHNLKPKKIFILELDEKWGDYKEVSKIYIDRKYHLLIRKNTFLHQRLLGINYNFLDLKDYIILSLEIDESNLHLFEDYISNEKPKLELVKGIKVSRTAFMKGYGPVFKLDKPIIITIEGKRNTVSKVLDLSKLKSGIHILKLCGGGRRTIEIVDIDSLKDIVELQKGIDIKRYTAGGTDLIGQNFNLKNTRITPRVFIEKNLLHRRNKLSLKDTTNNVVLLNLKRSKYGSNWEN